MKFDRLQTDNNHGIAFDVYQDDAHSTATYPDKDNHLKDGAPFPPYAGYGLGGEAGEFLDKMAKIERDKNGQISETDRIELLKELGDVLWFVAECATQLSADLSFVARLNINKLKDRQKRGVQGGSGDNR